jgi:non-specific serine/threonine protein kinase
MRSMSVDEVDQRLDQRFRVVTGGSRLAPRRQQTLRALIDWSYDLLDDNERMLLGRLSIFAGGWTLQAAEQCCGGEDIGVWEVLDLLTSLADKSLLAAEEHNGATRYRLLETVRQYAPGAAGGTRRRDAMAAPAPGMLPSPGDGSRSTLRDADREWLVRLDIEHDNLRSALAWSNRIGGDAAQGWSGRHAFVVLVRAQPSSGRADNAVGNPRRYSEEGDGGARGSAHRGRQYWHTGRATIP